MGNLFPVPATAPTLASLQAQSTRTYAAAGFASNLTAFPPVGNSVYHGGSVELTKRMSKGLPVKANYTWSKAITNLRPERGLSAIHHEHHFAGSWVWDLPRFRNSGRLISSLVAGRQQELGSRKPVSLSLLSASLMLT